jgi:hypothetical protein
MFPCEVVEHWEDVKTYVLPTESCERAERGNVSGEYQGQGTDFGALRTGQECEESRKEASMIADTRAC